MTEIVKFLSTIHPYDALSRDELARVASFFSRRDWQAGDTVYRHGEALEGIFLIEDAEVEVTDRAGAPVSTLGRGNSFGERGLMRDGHAATNAVVRRGGPILMLEAREFRRLLSANAAFGRFFNRGSGRAAVVQGAQFADLRVADLLAGRAPVTCAPDTPITEAARIMRAAGVSSLGVVGGGDALLGIVTVRDMSNKVVAEGRDGTGPVSAIMTADPLAVDEDLRRRPDAMGRFEGVGSFARREPVIVDHIATPPQQPARFDAIRADMAGHHHAVQGGAFGRRGGHDLHPWHWGDAAHIGSVPWYGVKAWL